MEVEDDEEEKIQIYQVNKHEVSKKKQFHFYIAQYKKAQKNRLKH